MTNVFSHRKGLWLVLILLSIQLSAQVVRQPYLQVVTATSIVLRWDTSTPEVGTVNYGVSATSLTSAQTESNATMKHQVKITGLSPKQKYYYSVTGPSGGSPDQYFISAPTIGTVQSTRIWVVTDFGQSPSSDDDARRVQTVGFWKAFNNNDYHADFALSMGDQTEDDLESELQNNYFNQLAVVLRNTPLFSIAGNHEDTDGQVSYKETFSVPTNAEAGGYPSGTNDYYSFTYGNIHVVGLTVEGNVSISGAQKTWLQNDLANNHSDWLIAFMHRPMHSAGYHPTDGDATARAMKANWLPLLEAAGVDLIICGHNHCYERSYMLDNLIGDSQTLTDANKIDTTIGRIDETGAYYKDPGKPHRGTIFITCEAGGDSNDASHLPVPLVFDPVVFKQSNDEGSLVIDVNGSTQMDVKFLCDQPDLFTGSHIWDHFTIVKSKTTTAVGDHPTMVPAEFSITNYPNPFNPSTRISYNLPQRGSVKIVVYDLLGRIVSTLLGEVKDQGNHTIDWYAKDGKGNDLASGIYIAQIQSGQLIKSAKMMLLR